jgi:hypothetical protein
MRNFDAGLPQGKKMAAHKSRRNKVEAGFKVN